MFFKGMLTLCLVFLFFSCSETESPDGTGCKVDDTKSCYTGVNGTLDIGVCKAGIVTCSNDGTWGDCEEEVIPSEEICDGLDNDCNDSIDDHLTGATSDKVVGVCANQKKQCDGFNGWIEPDYTNISDYEIVETLCDGRDNNCDGTVDEDCSCTDDDTQSCGILLGECRQGTQTCTSGLWGECIGGILPSEEICDGLDNSCNGRTDDDLSPPNANKIYGVCAGSKQVCDGFNGWIEPIYPDYREEELCDGLDNNCDNVVDENFIDSDDDGVANCVDECDYDPNKSEIGICGCGVSEIDIEDAENTCDNCKEIENNGKKYLFCNEELTRLEAQNRCNSVAYTLLEINDETENTWILGKITELFRDASILIGLNDFRREGEFYWNNKAVSLVYARWLGGEPTTGNGHCTEINENGKWVNIDCGEKRNFICEENPILLYQSCKEILDRGASTGSGTYTIDADSDSNGALEPFDVECDMTTSGGGWTTVKETTNYQYREWPRGIHFNPYLYEFTTEQINALRAVSREGKQVFISRVNYNNVYSNKMQYKDNTYSLNLLNTSGTVTTLNKLPMKQWKEDCSYFDAFITKDVACSLNVENLYLR